MLSRALSLATVTLLVACLTAGLARAQNLDAGKSPSQIFSNTCSACHKSPRGLLKTTPASSLPGFLRQHYTTGSDMASLLSSYLISNGAADPRYQGKDQKRDARQDRRQQDGRSEAKPEQPERLGRRQPAAAPQDSTSSDVDAARRQGERVRLGREGRRYGRSRAAPDAAPAADGQPPVQAASDGKPGGRQKLGRRGRPVPQQAPRTEQTAPGNAAKTEDAADSSKAGSTVTNLGKPISARPDPDKTDAVTSEGGRPAGARENIGGESNPLRSDPVQPGAAAATATDGTASTPATTPPADPPVPPTSR